MFIPALLLVPLVPQAQGDGGSLLISFLPLILIFAVFWFFIIRPQRKKENERKKMIEAVKKGDSVITIGGIFGKVTQVDDNSVLVQIDSNTKIRVQKSAISAVEN